MSSSSPVEVNPQTPAPMGQRLVGKFGFSVSEFAIGPYSATVYDKSNDGNFVKILDRYLSVGGNHVDLSNAYTGAERMCGEWRVARRVPRDDLVISSKVGFPVGKGPNNVGLSRKHIMQSIDDSLRDLQTDFVDIYYCHTFDAVTDLTDTMRTLNDLVRRGKVHYIGLSNFCGWQLQKAVDLAEHMGLAPVTVLQQQYNLLDRFPEYEVMSVVRNEGLGMFCWGPLAAGWLTGKYAKDTAQAQFLPGPSLGTSSRAGFELSTGFSQNSFEGRNNDRTWHVLDTLQAISTESGKTMAQIAMSWVKDRPGVTAPIIGARTVEHLDDVLGCIGYSLPVEYRERLDAASAMPAMFPQQFVNYVTPVGRRSLL